MFDKVLQLKYVEVINNFIKKQRYSVQTVDYFSSYVLSLNYEIDFTF